MDMTEVKAIEFLLVQKHCTDQRPKGTETSSLMYLKIKGIIGRSRCSEGCSGCMCIPYPPFVNLFFSRE